MLFLIAIGPFSNRGGPNEWVIWTSPKTAIRLLLSNMQEVLADALFKPNSRMQADGPVLKGVILRDSAFRVSSSVTKLCNASDVVRCWQHHRLGTRSRLLFKTIRAFKKLHLANTWRTFMVSSEISTLSQKSPQFQMPFPFFSK